MIADASPEVRHTGRTKETNVFRERVHARRARTLVGVVAVAAAIAISGCAEFDPSHPPSATQTQTLGSVAVTVNVCATLDNQSPQPAGSCTQNNANANEAAQSGPTQLFLGFRVPAGTGAPPTFASSSTGPTDSGPQLQFTQNPQYAGELQRLEPAPANEEWVGYTSQYVSYNSASGDQNFTATVDFGLPTNANGSPFAGPFTWQAVVGGREFVANGVTPDQDAPVDCESSLTTGLGGPTGAEWICVDDAYPATLGSDNTLATRDAGIVPGSPTSAVAGTVASAPFTLAYAGGALPAATFALGAVTTVPGASATPSQATLAPATNSSTPVDVSVPVPATTAPGTYDVTLTGVLPDGEQRTGTAQLTVTAPPAVPAQPANPASVTASTPPTRCKVPRLAGKTISKATTLLRNANCRLGKVGTRHAQARQGTIIEQSVAAGHLLTVGTKVNVTASLGPKRSGR
jgi:PASTA domain